MRYADRYRFNPNGIQRPPQQPIPPPAPPTSTTTTRPPNAARNALIGIGLLTAVALGILVATNR